MNAEVYLLVLQLVGGICLGFIILLAGYKWGSFSARQALAANSPKWKAYVLALIPPAAFAVGLHFDGEMARFAGRSFWSLATPAVLATCYKYNAGRHSVI